MKTLMKPLVAAVLVGVLAGACTVRSHTTVEKPVASSTAVVVPASPPPSTVVVHD
jgi:hypothetical protein